MGQSATSKLTHNFLVAGGWANADFDSKYKNLSGETRAHGIPIHKEKKLSSKKESA